MTTAGDVAELLTELDRCEACIGELEYFETITVRRHKKLYDDIRQCNTFPGKRFLSFLLKDWFKNFLFRT